MYNRLVIAVDGSDEARHAAARGFNLAETFDATVELVYVVEERTLSLTRSAAEEDSVRAHGEGVLEALETAATDRGIDVATTLEAGKASVRISEFATERDASLVVLGRQGRTGLGRRLLGGVTERVLHQCEVPVLVVPSADDDTSDAVRNILLPTDGTDEEAVRHAVAMADRFGATLHVLNVVDLQAAGGLFDAGGLEREFVERLENIGREVVTATAADVEAQSPSLDVRTVVERSTHYRGVVIGIREYIAANDVDLVVMGSHGRSTVGRGLVGSITSSVLRSVDVPVLVVEYDS